MKINPACIALLAGLAMAAVMPVMAGEAPVYPAELLEQLTASAERQSDDSQSKPADPATRLATLAAKPTGDPVIAHQLRSNLLALALPLASDVREQVNRLTLRDDRIMVWMEHQGLPKRPTVAIDVAATARWTLQQDEYHRKAHSLAQSLRHDGRLADDVPAEAWALLPRYASSDQHRALAAQLRQRLGEAAGIEVPLAVLARAHDDWQLAFELVARGRHEGVRAELPALLEAFPQQRRQLLQAALQRPDLANATLTHLSPFAGESWARETLRERLADQRDGGAAALAIARSDDAGLLAEMQQLMFADGPAASRAALALHLNDSAYARQLLDGYLREQPDGRFSAQVREWLK